MGSELKFLLEKEIDPEILELPATKLVERFAGPVVFDLSNSSAPPLFVSVLLHGNETSGWNAVRSFLSERIKHSQRIPSLVLLVGNVHAAARAMRSLDNQVDFNRIWDKGESDEQLWAEEVFNYVKQKRPQFALDLHNFSGPNPHHSVITDGRSATLDAAIAFSPLAIFAQLPKGILTRKFSELCTSLTLELGMPEDPESEARAEHYLNSLTNGAISNNAKSKELRVLRNKIRVVVDQTNGYSTPDLEPILHPNFAQFAFETVEAGTVMARIKKPTSRLRAIASDSSDVSQEYLQHDEARGEISLRKNVIISMYTRDSLIAIQDCVCYFLEPLELHQLD